MPASNQPPTPPTRAAREVRSDLRSRDRDAALLPEAAGLQLEELGPADVHASLGATSDLRLRVAVVAMAVIVGAGVVGKLTGDRPVAYAGEYTAAAAGSPAPADVPAAPGINADIPSTGAASATAALAIVSPAAGAIVEGAVVGLHASTALPLDSVLLTALIGDAEIGRVTIRDVPAGALDVSLPVFAPPVALGAELLLLAPAPAHPELLTATALRRGAIADRAFSLRPNGPLGLWQPGLTLDAERLSIRVSGCAPLDLGTLEVRLVARSGRVLDRSPAPIGRDEALPGALGGRGLGLGSFAVTLSTTERVDAVRVELDWRDPISSSWGTSVQRIDLAAEPPTRGA